MWSLRSSSPIACRLLPTAPPQTLNPHFSSLFFFCSSNLTPHSCSFTARFDQCRSISCCSSAPALPLSLPGPVVRRRKRYRKSYPGEAKGVTEEMRFVAMRLRNGGKRQQKAGEREGEEEESEETWYPTMEGFLKYLVDSKVVFDTLERIVDQSDDVAYAYFRKTGLERSECLSKDIVQFSQLGFAIPGPSSPGTTYASYLKEIAIDSVPSFLSHFYNIYFGHIAGGQAIGKQVSEKLLEGSELEFYKWEGDELDLLKDVRDKLNKVGEHWSRDIKNKCLRETTKCFRYSGQIVRLIIL